MRTWLRTAAGAAAVALIATACGGGGGGGGDDAGTESDVTLRLMHPHEHVKDELFDAFEAETGINVEVQQIPQQDPYKQRIRTLSSSNDLPDVMAVPTGPDMEDLMETGTLLDLNDALAEPAFDSDTPWGETFQDDLLDLAMRTMSDEVRPNGEQFQVPAYVVSLVALYNADVYDELGLEAPTSWDQFMSNNQAIVDADKIPLSVIGQDFMHWWASMVWDQTAREFGRAEFESGEAKWNDPALDEGLKIVEDMATRGFFDPGGATNGITETQSLFMSGELIQFVMLPGQVPKYVNENAPFGVGAFPIPAAKEEGIARSLGGAVENYAVNKNSEHVDEAVQLIKYMTSATYFEQVLEDYVIPTIDMPAIDDPIVQAYVAAGSRGFGGSDRFAGLDPELYDHWKNVLMAGLFNGEYTAVEVGDEMERLYRESLGSS